MRKFIKAIDWEQAMWHLLGSAVFVGLLLAAAMYRLDH